MQRWGYLPRLCLSTLAIFGSAQLSRRLSSQVNHCPDAISLCGSGGGTTTGWLVVAGEHNQDHDHRNGASFNTRIVQRLFRIYGANFYHGETTKVTLALVKGDKGWQIATE
jgi:hypothetical protein